MPLVPACNSSDFHHVLVQNVVIIIDIEL
eukprot:SAG11_NODE_36630_length_260_cov_1.583851_1_plen_28_part_01